MISVRIVTPKGVYKETETTILNVETIDGQRGILPEHLPIVTMLKNGVLNMVENGNREYYFCGEGLLYFRDNKAEILTDSVFHSSELNEEEVLKEKTTVEKQLEEAKEGTDTVLLKKALTIAEAKLRALSK